MKKYPLINIDCASCAAKIEEGVRKLEEVRFVSVNFAGSSISIETDDLEKVIRRIKEIEPEVELIEDGDTRNLVAKSEIIENKGAIIKAVSSLVLLVSGIVFQEELHNSPYRLLEYLIFIPAFLISGWKVITNAIRMIIKGEVFNEQFLMTVATLSAILIGEMAEAVAVMWFYVVGELFQDMAVNRSRKSIKSLLEIKPDYANLKIDEEIKTVSPEEVKIGDIIIVKAGEKIPLDGTVLEGTSFADTSALTGESVPKKIEVSDEVLAGMINQTGLLTIEVEKTFGESSVSKILELVENATSKKAKTEKFITSFARYYTPVVVFGAVLLALLPPLLVAGATFNDWFYRALVVLVISCPCALVISIPLGYFGGIGNASKKGILVKGSNFLDALTQVGTVVFDKTGTLTKGEFKVSSISTANGYSELQILEYAALAESHSNHPIAKSILEAYGNEINGVRISAVEELSGHGVKALIDDKEILAGNDKLLHKEKIEHTTCDADGTVVFVVVDRTYAGNIIISDNVKEDAADAIDRLKKKGISTVMLTGDNKTSAESYAKKLGINKFFAELLPQGKVKHIEDLIDRNEGKVAFVGDGINDAPVIARADIGIAMGALGSDAAIETADVVFMTDSPSKVASAIEIAQKTRTIVWQNIFFALGVKLLFVSLGVLGIATMWEAVFGDMGVALIAVFNSIRVLKFR